ncbi:MAG TPA: SDR family NAD(P)-dependent oxidoreductase [Terriglobales bacterium]|jgi:3-oxoacyl-[acyl-carrier protein] reductase|nr:SDR family NAD(P)-dependent oxidoreductase [Terriglobales bacterium]
MPISLSLEGKVALITGGSRGIGAATVRMFVEAGARVMFNYEKAQGAADKLVHECGDKNCAAVACNLERSESAQALVCATVEQFGRLDILVANHGIWPADDIPIDKMSDEHWRRTLAINLDSVFALVKHSVIEMKKQASAKSPAHIVLISSTSGQRGEAFHTDYSASKGALISLTKSLALELARHHIYVNSVAPGWVDTDMSRSSLDDPAIAKEVLRPIPMGRVGTPEEIAGPILFLCTPHAGFITGEIFNVNGGAVLVG